MVEKNKIEVFIGGKVYKLLGEESEEYMQKVARYIDKKMLEISSAQRSTVLSTAMVATLTSINVADEYFKIKEQNEKLLEKLEKCSSSTSNEDIDKIAIYENALGELQEENIALKEKLDKVIIELDNAKSKLNEYIENFDANS